MVVSKSRAIDLLSGSEPGYHQPGRPIAFLYAYMTLHSISFYKPTTHLHSNSNAAAAAAATAAKDQACKRLAMLFQMR